MKKKRNTYIKSIVVMVIFLLNGFPLNSTPFYSISAESPNDIKVVVNGKQLVLSDPPTIENGRTLVPVRAIFEALGATVTWNSENNSAIGTNEKTKIIIKVDDIYSIVNGESREIGIPARIINDRVFVPVRFISESLGAKVDWDESAKTIFIKLNEMDKSELEANNTDNSGTQNIYEQEDVFASFLKDNSAPQIIKELDKKETSDGLIVRKVVFRSRVVDGVNSDVYAVIVRPKADGNYPGILVCHGGGGKADEGTAINFAKHGYIVVAPDFPGICANNVENSSGPWKFAVSTFPEGTRFRMSGDPKKSVIYDAVIAGIQSFNLLGAQDNIQRDRMAITGSSWGGYMTTMLSGLLGDRVYASYSVFGCGFYDEGTWATKIIKDVSEEDKNAWLKYLDAGRRAAGIKSRFFIDAAANDTYFWPTAVMTTLEKVNGTKNQFFSPNSDHYSSANNKYFYMDYYLKGIGNPLPVVNIAKSSKEADGSSIIDIKVDSSEELNEVKLLYSVPDVGWTYRKWFSILASKVDGNTYKVIIPKEIMARNIDWYIIATDIRGARASSFIYNYKSERATLVGENSPPIVQASDKKYLNGNEKNPVIFTKSNDESFLINLNKDDHHFNEAYSEADVINDVECRNMCGKWRNMYFTVSDKYMTSNDSSLTIKITYFDRGNNELGIQYSSTGNLYQDKRIKKTDTNTWKTAEFKIQDAKFEHKQKLNSDFRIYPVEEDGFESISKVEVIKN